jgi:hypothetical protein
LLKVKENFSSVSSTLELNTPSGLTTVHYAKGTRARTGHALRESTPVNPVVVVIVQNFISSLASHCFLLDL